MSSLLADSPTVQQARPADQLTYCADGEMQCHNTSDCRFIAVGCPILLRTAADKSQRLIWQFRTPNRRGRLTPNDK